MTLLTVGTCSITAAQTGNADWNAASTITQTFGVSTSGGGEAEEPPSRTSGDHIHAPGKRRGRHDRDTNGELDLQARVDLHVKDDGGLHHLGFDAQPPGGRDVLRHRIPGRRRCHLGGRDPGHSR